MDAARTVQPMGECVCGVCWTEFESPVALLEHEEAEERALAAGEIGAGIVEALGDGI
jgi:hypothetical protein